MSRKWQPRLGRSPRTGPTPTPVGTPTPARRLVTSGIFDAEFYAAAVGRDFETPHEAAEDLVASRAGSKPSPHPFLMTSNLPKWLAPVWERGDVGSLLRCLRTERGVVKPLGPLLAPTALGVTPETLMEKPGGALAWFLEHSTSETPMPVPDGYPGPAPSAGQARAAMLETARTFRRHKDLHVARRTDTWDEAAETSWKQRWAAAPLPDVEGPLVTIVTPVRNRPGQILEAIASVQQQTLDSWEMVIVDDGSVDETPEVVEQAAAADPRIRLLRREHGGVSAARNAAVADARGRYLAFLDSDNTWRPDFLRLAVAALHGQDLDAGYAGIKLALAEGDPPSYRAFEGGLEHLMVLNHVDLNILVCRTDVAREVGGFDTTLRRWVDHDFAIKLARRGDLALLPFIGCDYDHREDAADRITTSESDSWQFVVISNHWVDWPAMQAGLAERVTGRVSVVIPTYEDHKLTVAAVNAVLEHSVGHDIEVVLIDNGSALEVGMQLVGTFLTEPRVRYERMPRNFNFAAGCNIGFARSTGEFIVFLNNDTEVREGWLPPLLAELADDVAGVQPLLLYNDDTIQAAGTVFPVEGFLPCHFLAGHPREDAVHSAGQRFEAVTAAAVLLRAADVVAVRGFDPIYRNGMEDVDLCLKLRELRPGGFRVATESVVTHFESKTPSRHDWSAANRVEFMRRWAGRLPASDADKYDRAGFTLAHVGGDSLPVPVPRPVVVRTPPVDAVTGLPRLRWGIRLPSIPGPKGDLWGDTHLAESLAAGLRRLGQEVVTYRHGSHGVPASYLDDVVLGIRGLDMIPARPGQVNALWIISHPEDVATEELNGFDLVFAASAPWAAGLAERSGREVLTLLQATDRTRLPGREIPRGDGSEPIFVGQKTSRRERAIVNDSIAAGLHFVVHGPGWDGLLPEGVWQSTNVPNEELTTLYREHGLVLADHWPDMAAEGFIANRLYDAVGAGARVISDEVAGVEELFGGAVQVYRSAEDLARLCSPEGREAFPDDDELDAIADRVAAEHSFDARARQLLEAVLDVRLKKS